MGGYRTGYEVRRLPLERMPQVEMLRILSRRPAMYGLFQVDVTGARELIRQESARRGSRLSFTAFLIACLARAVDENREVQAFRRGTRLVVFDQVDVATLIEVDAGAARVPLFHVVRDAARKSVFQIHDEIRASQADRAGLEGRRRQIRRARRLPRPVRSLLWRILAVAPRTWKRYGGTVVLTSVGMFARRPGWGLSTPGGYPLGVTAGGIGRQPEPAAADSEPREKLCLTVSFDHATIDGAPAARFTSRLSDLIESGEVLHPAA